MEKLTKTAKTLDKVFSIVYSVFTALAIAAGVCIGILVIGYLLKLDPETIGTGYESLDFGALELQIADGFAPGKWYVLLQAGVVLALCCACVLIGRQGIRYIRAILHPMTEGKPFDNAVSINLKKLSILSIVLGIALNVCLLVEQVMTVYAYDLTNLLISEKITHISVNLEFDLTFLLFSAFLLLLSYVFHYGEELQKLSDETV